MEEALQALRDQLVTQLAVSPCCSGLQEVLRCHVCMGLTLYEG